MCMTCGCERPDDAHGNQQHIVMKQIEQAAQAVKITPEEAVENIEHTFKEKAASGKSG